MHGVEPASDLRHVLDVAIELVDRRDALAEVLCEEEEGKSIKVGRAA